MLFGDRVFLFNWVDGALVFLIEHYISNYQPLFTLWVIFVIVEILIEVYLEDNKLLTGEATTFYELSLYVAWALEFGIKLVYWDRIMKQSVNAIKYLDPTWDKVPSGERLLPFFL